MQIATITRGLALFTLCFIPFSILEASIGGIPFPTVFFPKDKIESLEKSVEEIEEKEDEEYVERIAEEACLAFEVLEKKYEADCEDGPKSGFTSRSTSCATLISCDSQIDDLADKKYEPIVFTKRSVLPFDPNAQPVSLLTMALLGVKKAEDLDLARQKQLEKRWLNEIENKHLAYSLVYLAFTEEFPRYIGFPSDFFLGEDREVLLFRWIEKICGSAIVAQSQAIYRRINNSFTAVQPRTGFTFITIAGIEKKAAEMKKEFHADSIKLSPSQSLRAGVSLARQRALQGVRDTLKDTLVRYNIPVTEVILNQWTLLIFFERYLEDTLFNPFEGSQSAFDTYCTFQAQRSTNYQYPDY